MKRILKKKMKKKTNKKQNVIQREIFSYSKKHSKIIKKKKIYFSKLQNLCESQ